MHQAKKRFGQNFLTDKNLLKKIVEKADVQQKNVLEIGPGLGALTQFLVLEAKKYLAYEIDYSLKSKLNTFLSNKAHIIFKDFLEADVVSDLKDYFNLEAIHLIGNLPYYITTPIIFKFLELDNIHTATIMVQKEVGERMLSKHNIKSYNAFSAILQYYTHVELITHVGRKMFNPVPKVDSMVIKLTKIPKKLESHLESFYIKLVKAAFMHKRKTMLNNLSMELKLDKTRLKTILLEIGFDENTRAEALSVLDFIQLTKKLYNETT